MRADARTRSRVGIIIFAALVVFGGIVMTIGGKTGFFLARTSYFARFPNTLGLVEGNQVRLAGVTVGAVRKIEVPKRPGEDLTIHFDIERKYQHLVKIDSRVEIKTIGLLGDKYLEVTVGTPDKPDLEPDHEIMAYRGAELDKILSGSGDLVDNVVAITKSLKTILGRTERGEGFLGEITSPEKEGKELSRSLRQTIDSANALLVEVRQGKGLLPKLINDRALADDLSKELEGAVGSLHRILAAIDKGTQSGDGLVPALFTDPNGKARVYALLDSLKGTADGLSAFAKDLEGGQGAVPKLLKDPVFAKEFLGDLKALSSHLANVAAKLTRPTGRSAGSSRTRARPTPSTTSSSASTGPRCCAGSSATGRSRGSRSATTRPGARRASRFSPKATVKSSLHSPGSSRPAQHRQTIGPSS